MENAKRSAKARLLDNEGAMSKVSNIDSGLNSIHGINSKNKYYNEIDGITKEDIVAYAQNAFSGNPVYAITATQDTLNANKEYFESLKNGI